MPKLPSHEDLVTLGKYDPEKLEQLRRQLVDSLIESAPEHTQRRLRGIQFQIDAKRRIHKNPVSACVAISQMMYDSVNELNQALNGGCAMHTHRVSNVVSFPADISSGL